MEHLPSAFDLQAAAADIFLLFLNKQVGILRILVSGFVCRLVVYTHHASPDEALGLLPAFGQFSLDQQLI